MMALIPAWAWRWIAIALVAATLAGYVALRVHSHDQVKYDALKLEYANFVSATKAQGVAQEQHTAKIAAAQDKATKEAADDYTKRITDLRAYYARRLSDESRKRAGSSQVPGIPATPGGTDEGAAYYELAGACAETTQQLVSLQDWIRAQVALNP